MGLEDAGVVVGVAGWLVTCFAVATAALPWTDDDVRSSWRAFATMPVLVRLLWTQGIRVQGDRSSVPAAAASG